MGHALSAEPASRDVKFPVHGPCAGTYFVPTHARQHTWVGGVVDSEDETNLSFCEGVTVRCPGVVLARSTSEAFAWLRPATLLVDSHVPSATSRCCPKCRPHEHDEALPTTQALQRRGLVRRDLLLFDDDARPTSRLPVARPVARRLQPQSGAGCRTRKLFDSSSPSWSALVLTPITW